MEHQIGDVMATRVQSENLAIDLMRKPCHVMPVARRHRRTSPPNIFPVQPGVHMGIVSHIKIVIEIDEGIVPYGKINTRRSGGEQNANQHVLFRG